MNSGEENIMLILSSPSGVGKTTLTKKIQQKYQSFKISVSHTTRLPRSNEVDGVDYHFISKLSKNLFLRIIFMNMQRFLKLLWHVKKSVDDIISQNDIIFDIDWQGTKQLSKYNNLNLIKIYLITKDKNQLKQRLLKRDQNTKEEIEKRFKSFDEDIKHWSDYDYIIINNNLEVCFKQIETIIKNHKNNKLIGFK